jgi:cell division protein FtsB
VPPIFFLMAIAFWGIVLGGGFYFALRFIRLLESRNADAAQLAPLRARVEALEEAAEHSRRDIERLESGHEFTTQLLTSRNDEGKRTP